MDYASAIEYLHGGRYKHEWWRNSRPLDYNTWLEAPDWLDAQEVDVRYYSTYVVRYHADGSATITTGGWDTYSTLDRINRFSPSFVPRVFRDRGLRLAQIVGYTPERTQQCPECHGAYQSPEKQAVAILGGWRPQYMRNGHTDMPTCRCRLTGYVTVGGNPAYERWDGEPLTFDASGRIEGKEVRRG